MILCGIDIETSGLEKETDHITEIAWSIKRHAQVRSLVDKRYYIRGVTEIPENVIKLTKIEVLHCTKLGRTIEEVSTELLLDIMLTRTEAMVAHNKNFDQNWLEHKAPILKEKLPKWIDTLHDIDWDKTDVRSHHLPYLCAEHGFLNPFPHNAMSDVWAMLRLLDEYDIEEVSKRSESPMVTVKAKVGYDNRELAKEQRFRWEKFNERHYPKTWIKVVKDCDVPALLDKCDFEIEVIDTW